jgi:WD40 repeat protein
VNWRHTIAVSLAALFLAFLVPGPDSLAVDSAVRLTAVLLAAPSGVNSLEFSPDGKLLATAYGNGTVRLWDSATSQPVGSPLQTGIGSQGSVNAVAFGPGGSLLAAAYADGTVRLWDPGTSQLHSPVLRITDSQSSANAVAFSPDGKLLATAYGNGTVRLWDLATSQPEGSPLHTGPESVNALAFSPDGKLLATAYGDAIRIWVRAAGQPGGPDNVSWLAILAFAIAIAVSALAVIATVRGIRRLKKAYQ